MIGGLTLGLLGLSAALVARALRWPRTEQTLGAASGLAAMGLFAAAPRPFAEVLPWAGAGVMIWLFGASGRKPDLVHAAAAGFLIGLDLPHLTVLLGDMVAWPAAAGSVLIIGLGCGAGVVLAGAAGGAMAAFAGCLATGAFGYVPVSVAVFAAAALASAPGRHAPGLALAAFPVLPVVAFLEGAA